MFRNLFHNFKITSLSIGLFLAGCTTSYQEVGFSGGYDELKIADNLYKVSFSGNGYTSGKRVEDFAMLRSAELTIQNGFKYFIFLDGETEYMSQTQVSPVYTDTNATINTYGNSAQLNARSTTHGGNVNTITKAKRENTVMMFNERPDGILVYEAKSIWEQLSQRYDIKTEAK